MRHLKNNERGITLMEVILIITIVSLLAILGLGMWTTHKTSEEPLSHKIFAISDVVDELLWDYPKAEHFSTSGGRDNTTLLMPMDAKGPFLMPMNFPGPRYIEISVGNNDFSKTSKRIQANWSSNDVVGITAGENPGEYYIIAYNDTSGEHTSSNPLIYDSAHKVFVKEMRKSGDLDSDAIKE